MYARKSTNAFGNQNGGSSKNNLNLHLSSLLNKREELM